ncbi:MAG: hypothetical protein IJN45_08955 [Alistipes sp.]|nr:hypothetical protein [Alistipes sp.]MBQ6989257.1 hypothetical protein [Alistipes sp.]MBR3757948.1 hypothetical protein [Bacteroidaceae bacterium]
MKKELWNIFVYVLIGVLLCLNVFQCSRGTQGNLPPGSYTDTLTVYDTVRVEIPAPKDEKPLGSVTAKLPVSVPKQTENERKLQETVQMLRDSLANYGKTVPDHFEELSEKVTPDSVSVEIPITQKVYETDRYRAVVSGYKPSLDDIYIYQPTQIVQVKSKPKRWGVGIQVGYGVTLKQTPQFSPYVGVGVSYNLFQF